MVEDEAMRICAEKVEVFRLGLQELEENRRWRRDIQICPHCPQAIASSPRSLEKGRSESRKLGCRRDRRGCGR